MGGLCAAAALDDGEEFSQSAGPYDPFVHVQAPPSLAGTVSPRNRFLLQRLPQFGGVAASSVSCCYREIMFYIALPTAR